MTVQMYSHPSARRGVAGPVPGLASVPGTDHARLKKVGHFKLKKVGHLKLKVTAGSVASRAIHLGIGVAQDGRKEVLGLWLGERERAKFWLAVLQDLRQRGVDDILIAVVNGLSGFPEALEMAFPNTTVQTCIVHLLRNSLSCASYRECAKLASALKPTRTATNVEAAKKPGCLALREATRSWTTVPSWWGRAKRELAIHFGERFDASTGYVLPNQSGGNRRGGTE